MSDPLERVGEQEPEMLRVLECGCRMELSPWSAFPNPMHVGKVGACILSASSGWRAVKWGDGNDEICTADKWERVP